MNNEKIIETVGISLAVPVGHLIEKTLSDNSKVYDFNFIHKGFAFDSHGSAIKFITFFDKMIDKGEIL